MELIFRALITYFGVFLIMRITGNRQFGKLTAFDLVLVIIIGEVAGNTLIGEDYSVTAGMLAVSILVAIDITISFAKLRFKILRPVFDGVPVLLVKEGVIIHRNLERARVAEQDILTSAREMQGLERLDQVKYAVLEADGKISIVPTSDAP